MEEIISLKEASTISGYTTDYLGYLIRNGKLNGRKMGRSWVTTKQDLEKYLSTSHYHGLTKLLSYCFSTKVLFYISILIIAVLVFIIYFQPFRTVTTQVAPTNTNSQSPEIDSDLHL